MVRERRIRNRREKLTDRQTLSEQVEFTLESADVQCIQSRAATDRRLPCNVESL